MTHSKQSYIPLNRIRPQCEKSALQIEIRRYLIGIRFACSQNCPPSPFLILKIWHSRASYGIAVTAASSENSVSLVSHGLILCKVKEVSVTSGEDILCHHLDGRRPQKAAKKRIQKTVLGQAHTCFPPLVIGNDLKGARAITLSNPLCAVMKNIPMLRRWVLSYSHFADGK